MVASPSSPLGEKSADDYDDEFADDEDHDNKRPDTEDEFEKDEEFERDDEAPDAGAATMDEEDPYGGASGFFEEPSSTLAANSKRLTDDDDEGYGSSREFADGSLTVQKAANAGEGADRNASENQDEGDDEGYASSREFAEPSLPLMNGGAAGDEGAERAENEEDDYDAEGDAHGDSYGDDDHDDVQDKRDNDNDGQGNHGRGDAQDKHSENDDFEQDEEGRRDDDQDSHHERDHDDKRNDGYLQDKYAAEDPYYDYDDSNVRERRDVHNQEAFGATSQSMGYTQDWQDDDAGDTRHGMGATTGTEYTNYSTISGGDEFEESAEDTMKGTGDINRPPIAPAKDEPEDDDDSQYSTRQFKATPDKQRTIKMEQEEADGYEDEAEARHLEAPAADSQAAGGGGELEQEEDEEEQDVWGDQDVVDAISLFKNGEFAKAAHIATAAAHNCKGKAQAFMEKCGRALEDDFRRPRSRPASAASHAGTGDAWRTAMDELAAAYEDAGDPDRAEALYLRMLAWREGAEQYEAANFSVSEGLFKKSPSYRSVEDATWFLQNLRPDHGHAAAEAVGLLALGDEVAAKAAVAVWTLALKPGQREKLTECGALELVAKAVAFHVDNPELQAAGCGALKLLCTGHKLASRNRRHLISKLGGAESITASIRLHQHDPEVQREACGALRAAAAKNPTGARRIIENDGFKVCLQAIAQCSNEAVGSMACKALEALQCASKMGLKNDAQTENLQAVWNSKLRGEREAGLQFCNEKIRDSLGVGDRIVIQALLGAASIFVEDGSVRYRALNLVEPVVACMQSFPGIEKIQFHCCKFLWSVTVGTDVSQAGTMQGAMARQESVAKVAESGGLGPICQAMKDLPCNASLQCLAIGTIRNVSYGDDRNKTLAVRAGAIPATCMAMQRFPKDANLQEQAIGALTSLCDTLGRATVAARLGSIESIIGALRRHANDVQAGHLAELGCIVLCMFCDDQQLRQQIQQKGAMSIAKVISRATNPEAQRWGFELLKGLSEH